MTSMANAELVRTGCRSEYLNTETTCGVPVHWKNTDQGGACVFVRAVTRTGPSIVKLDTNMTILFSKAIHPICIKGFGLPALLLCYRHVGCCDAVLPASNGDAKSRQIRASFRVVSGAALAHSNSTFWCMQAQHTTKHRGIVVLGT